MKQLFRVLDDDGQGELSVSDTWIVSICWQRLGDVQRCYSGVPQRNGTGARTGMHGLVTVTG